MAGSAETTSAARHPQPTITVESSGGEIADPRPIEARTMPVARPCAMGGIQADTPDAAAG